MMAFHNASSNWSDCCMNASAAGTSVRACMIMDIAALAMSIFCRFYVNSWGRAKIEKLEIVSECESSGTIFMYYRTEFFS